MREWGWSNKELRPGDVIPYFVRVEGGAMRRNMRITHVRKGGPGWQYKGELLPEDQAW